MFNFLDFFRLMDDVSDENIRSLAVLAKHAYLHTEQQRLYAKYKKTCPSLTSVVLVNYSVFPDCEVVATFQDGTRSAAKFEPGIFDEDADATLSHLISLYEINNEPSAL